MSRIVWDIWTAGFATLAMVTLTVTVLRAFLYPKTLLKLRVDMSELRSSRDKLLTSSNEVLEAATKKIERQETLLEKYAENKVLLEEETSLL